MPLVSEFADFTDALRLRREKMERNAPDVLRAVRDELADGDAGPFVRTSRLVDDAVGDLTLAEDELRAQNDELFRARLDVEEREAQFRQFFDLAPVANLVTSHDALIRHANAAACALLARPMNALAGKPLVCFVDLTERSAFRTALGRARASSCGEEWPIRLVPRGGVAVECRMRVRALPALDDDAEPTLAWCVTEELDPKQGEW